MEAGGLRVLEFKIQGCSAEVEGGGGRRAIKWAATASSCPERRGWRIFASKVSRTCGF